MSSSQHRLISSRRAPDHSCWRGGRRPPLMTVCTNSFRFRPSNGRRRLSISHRIRPKLYTSAFFSGGKPRSRRPYDRGRQAGRQAGRSGTRRQQRRAVVRGEAKRNLGLPGRWCGWAQRTRARPTEKKGILLKLGSPRAAGLRKRRRGRWRPRPHIYKKTQDGDYQFNHRIRNISARTYPNVATAIIHVSSIFLRSATFPLLPSPSRCRAAASPPPGTCTASTPSLLSSRTAGRAARLSAARSSRARSLPGRGRGMATVGRTSASQTLAKSGGWVGVEHR